MFQSIKEITKNPKLGFLSAEEKRVIFVVEGRPIPALKSVLSDKSPVFSSMFSGNLKESKEKEIVIEDTTYEAFNTFIGLLYCDHLYFDVDNNQLIRELYKLSDRYDVSRLADRITDELTDRNQLKGANCVSNEDFNRKWLTIRSIARMAFESQILRLIENVLTFIDVNFDHFLKKDYKELNVLNDLTDGRLMDLMANQCRKAKEDKKNRTITDPQCNRMPAKQSATEPQSSHQHYYITQYRTNQSVPQQFGYHNDNGAVNPMQAQAAAQSVNAANIPQRQSFGQYFLPPQNSGQRYNAVNTFPHNINAIPFNPQQNYMPTHNQSYDSNRQMGGNTSRR